MRLPSHPSTQGTTWRAIVLVVLVLLTFQRGLSQVSTSIVVHAPAEALSGTPIAVSAELLSGELIERVHFLYRVFGSSEYTRLEMDLRGNTARVLIPATQVRHPAIEYYLVLEKRDGTKETHPLGDGNDPFARPPETTLRITITADTAPASRVLLLSPEADATISPDDLLISVSLLRTDSTIDRSATRLFLNGADITAEAVFADDIIVYAPKNFAIHLAPGRHRFSVDLSDKNGNRVETAVWILTVGTGQPAETRPSTRPASYAATVQLESRREDVGGAGTWYNRGTAEMSTKYGDWRVRGTVFLTSDEEATRQPQNRYFVGVQSSWLRAGYGDSYPMFPGLILSGKRIRGVSSSLLLGTFNVDVALGRTTRGVEGRLLKTIATDTLALEQQRDPGAAYAQITPDSWGKFSYGTYERDLFVIRPSFGSGETWQLGFTWLKSKDDVSSITYGVRPQENLVVGMDFVTRMFDKRIELRGEGAFSAFNNDISSGSFTDAYIDSVYPGDADAIRRARDILDNFITVNDNLRPLSFKKLSTLAYEVGLGANILDNSFKATYIYRGSEYNSFGQTFLRKDIQGFNISDRVRLISNQVFLTLGYEQLKDNTSKTKVATTTFSNITSSVSYYPSFSAPNITLGYSRYSSDNGLPLTDNFSIDERTNRIFVQSSYQFIAGPEHNASIGFSTSDRKDDSPRRLDVKNTMLSLGVRTLFSMPLTTSIEYSLNLNNLPAGTVVPSTRKLDYSTIAIGARYEVIEEILAVQSSISPTFGDFDRTVFSAGSQWSPLPMMTFLVDVSFFRQPVGNNDSFLSLRYRYTL